MCTSLIGQKKGMKLLVSVFLLIKKKKFCFEQIWNTKWVVQINGQHWLAGSNWMSQKGCYGTFHFKIVFAISRCIDSGQLFPLLILIFFLFSFQKNCSQQKSKRTTKWNRIPVFSTFQIIFINHISKKFPRFKWKNSRREMLKQLINNKE